MSSHQPGMAIAKSLWSEVDIEKLTCCHCGKSISYDAVLARTFAIKEFKLSNETSYSQKIQVPSLSEELLVYHRHLECLAESTPYIAVSHVWHPEVAKLQHEEKGEPALVAEVAEKLLETPTRICKALATIEQKLEVWHDYLSVPQWQEDVKDRIIQHIPQIFNHAKFVLMHLADVDYASVHAMRYGASTEEVARGISNICNASYFSRVWTAMEYTKNRGTRVLVKDYIWVEPDPKSRLFMAELIRRWDQELAKHKHPTEVERMVGMGYNLVPWQLGSVQVLQEQNAAGQDTIFADAYGLLSRRNVTIPKDFSSALISTLKLNAVLARVDLKANEQTVMMQVMRYCLQKGDLSPLFMIPSSSQKEVDDSVMQQYGYLDTVTWGLGHEIEPPKFKSVKLESDNVILLAEELGVLRCVRRERTSWMSDWKSFSVNLKLALEAVGPLDLDAFINTLGARLYGLPPKGIHEYLSKKNCKAQLQENIRAVYNYYPLHDDDLERWIAEATGISNTDIKHDYSPMANLSSYAGSIHLGAAMAYIYVKCSRCNETFVIRVALLKHASDALGAVAFRIPGLRYWGMTNAGGAGFLLKDGQMIGRFIWGTPTCECDKLKEVAVKLENLPMPRANRYPYGSQKVKKGEWIPLRQEDRIKF